MGPGDRLVSRTLERNPILKAVVQVVLTVALTAALGPGGALASGLSAFGAGAAGAAAGSAIVTGLAGGNLGQMLKAGAIAGATFLAFNTISGLTNGFSGAGEAEAAGVARTWHETVDMMGRTRIVLAETGGPKIHYEFNAAGKYVGSW